MATQAYYDWLAAGRPFTLVAPLRQLRDVLRGYGYTVYDIGNTSHQVAEPPEDHMPYSATGWPVPCPRWWGHALDVMPPPTGSGLPSLAQLGAQIHADRQAGYAGTVWLKYMNWEPGDGSCWHDAWQPGYRRTSSGDRGHIHLSGRTDITTAPAYDPVARIRGGGDMSEKAGRIIEAYASGLERTGLGEIVAPTTWRIRDEAWQRQMTAAVAADAERDRAVLAAVTALATAGGVEAAPIVAAIEAVRSQVLAEITELQQQLAEQTARADAAEQREHQLLAQAHAEAATS